MDPPVDPSDKRWVRIKTNSVQRIVYNADEWWPGQMKHENWLLSHNEDVDTHQMDSDMDWDKHESKNN